jgi:hypothetical protein
MLIRKLLVLSVLCIFLLVSCKKNNADLPPNKLSTTKTIRFQLYTNQDFSTNESTIIFKASIQNVGNNQIIWDSTFATRKIKEIPGEANKIIVQKSILVTDSTLKVGFYYTITNVGSSWYLDTVGKGTSFKLIDYNFQ